MNLQQTKSPLIHNGNPTPPVHVTVNNLRREFDGVAAQQNRARQEVERKRKSLRKDRNEPT